jgi:GDSL/SGNH-like Acyl-Esterase family found in Pmr5 and Cas1p
MVKVGYGECRFSENNGLFYEHVPCSRVRLPQESLLIYVYFRGLILHSPYNCLSELIRTVTWENPNAIRCAMETLPIANSTQKIDVGTDWRLFTVAEDVMQSMTQVPIHFINITAMSEVRKDAHTSVHTLRQGKVLTPEQQANPATYADCIHWCLPGLPDVWNEFLYAKIMSN